MFQHSWLTRFLSLTMMVGAAIELVFRLLNIYSQGQAGSGLIVFGIDVLFLSALYFGFRFWRGSVFAYRAVLVLFITQIPVIAWGPLQMNWSTGVALPIAFNGIQENLWYLTYYLHLGYEVTFYFFSDGRVAETALGINFFALFASILLFRARTRVVTNGSPDLDETAPQV